MKPDGLYAECCLANLLSFFLAPLNIAVKQTRASSVWLTFDCLGKKSNLSSKQITATMARFMTAPLERDFIGYGSKIPRISWPGEARVAVNLVLVYEEGSEYSVLEGDGRNDGWGEYQTNVGPEIRDLGSETHFEYGSRAGVWRLVRLFDQFNVPVTVSATAQALERNSEVAFWMRARDHDLLGHGLRWTEFYTLTETKSALSCAKRFRPTRRCSAKGRSAGIHGRFRASTLSS